MGWDKMNLSEKGLNRKGKGCMACGVWISREL